MSIFSTPARKHTAYYDNLLTKSTPRTPVRELHTRIKGDNAGTIQSADDSTTSLSKSREVNRTFVIPKSSGHQARGRLTLERRKTHLKNADKTMSENTQIATSTPENRLTLQRRTRTGSIDRSAGIDSKAAKGTRLASSRSEQNVLSESNGTPISAGVHRSVSLKETACKINTRGPVSTFSTCMDVPSIHAIVRNKTLSSRPLLDVAKAREQVRLFHTPTKKTLFENIATKKKAFERLAGKEVLNPASINSASSEISKLGLRVQQTEILPVAAPRGTKASTAKPNILVTPVQARKTSGGEGRNATVAQTSVSAEPLMPSSDVLKQHELLKMENSAVTVAVRLRPFSSRENAEKALQVISMNGQETVVQHPDTKRIYSFTFDFSFYSVDEEDPGFACQQRVYEALARPLLQRAFEGFNTCLFAYGQTGSGKSYTMMGFGEESGVIPRFCQELFSRMISVENDQVTCHLEMSYFEVYNENIHDLLVDRDEQNHKKMPLRVREHPVYGPYVADLSTNVVSSYSDVQGWLDLGNKQRATAATGMNDKSSRSHSVFTLVMTQTKTEFVEGEEHDHRITSRINLVDLAGSERCNSAQTTGDRLREGASINKSLLTLGKVISALSEQALVKSKIFTPYRESVLTWLLKESLGGNSKTAMIATLSPADSNVQESLSTLRYAQQARTIINQAKVNEDTNAKLIRELKAEVEKLRAAQMSLQGVEPDRVRLFQQEIATLKSQLSQQERDMAEAHRAWKEKLERAEIRKREEARELQRVGVTFKMDNSLPNLVNLNEDPQLSEMLLYMIKDGQTKVGKLKAESIHDIQLSGALIADQHCVISSISGTISIIPMENAKTFVNGNLIFQSTILHHGDRVILGGDHYFRFNHPAEVHSGKQVSCWRGSGDGQKDFEFAKNELLAAQRAKLEAEIEEAHVRAKEEMMQGIQMAKHVAQKELCDQKALYEDCIRGLERELEEQAQRKRLQEEEARRQVASELAKLQSDKLELQREVETQKKRLRLQMETQAMEEHSVRHARIVEALEEEKQKISKDLEEMQMKMALGGNCIARTGAPQWDAMKLSLMIEEANKISAKLKKNTVFSRHESTQKADLEQGDAVQVRVQNTKMGIATFWSLDKFQDNMASMRELEQGEPTSKGDYVFYGPGDEWEQDLSASSTTTSFSRRKSRSLLKSRRISGRLYEIRVHPIQSLNNAASQSSGLMGGARPPSANLSSSDSAFPGICKELIGQTVARLRCCSGPVESMADHLISDLCSVYTAIHTISELYDHLDEDSQENVFMCNMKAQRQLVMATSALERAVSVTMQWLSSVRATSGMRYSTAEDVKFQVIKMGGFFQLLIQGCESEISSMVTEANKKSGQCLTTALRAIGHLATLTGMPLNVSELGSRATGKSSGTASLLEGISKGVSSLLVEALHITKEMLRDAQLAYPRTSTLQSLKSKSVDLACALQGYIHCHITERESSMEKAAREQEEEAACHLQTREEVRNTADRLFQLNQAVGELQSLLATCLRGKVCDVDFSATRVAISSLVRTIDELISGLPRTAAATSSSLQLPCIQSVMSARDELLLALRSLPTAFDQQEAGESKYFTGSDMSTEYRLSSDDSVTCQNSSRNILISKMVRHLSSGVSSNGSPQWV